MAVSLADSGGLGAVSIRRIAAELDARPMSIYAFAAVDSKDELHELMLDAVCDELILRSLPRGWREAVRAIAVRLRSVLLRHPWWIDLIGRNVLIGPNAARYREQTLAALAELEVDSTRRLAIIAAVETYVVGQAAHAIDERGGLHRRARPHAQWRRAVRSYQRQLIESGEFPHLAGLGPLPPPTRAAHQRQFELGLGWLLDGIAASIDSRATGT